MRTNCASRVPVRLCALALLLTGCASVDPRADYDQVDRRIEHAVGQRLTYRSDDEVAVNAQVAAMLENGVTAHEALQIVLLNNPQVRAALRRVGMARADVVQAGLLSNPTLGLFFLAPEGGGVTQFELYLSQNIADLWMIPARKRTAERELGRMIVTTAREIATLVYDARVAYFDAVGAERSLEIARENLKLAEHLTDITQTRLDAGAAASLDVNLARGLSLRAQVDERNARLAAASARRTLATLMGIAGPADGLRLTDSLPPPRDVPIDAEAMVSVALESRLEAQAALEAVQAAQARVKLEQAKILQTAELGFGLQRQAFRAAGGRNVLADTARSSLAAGQLAAPDLESRGQRREAKNQQIDAILGPSLNITLPIFDQNQAQITKARFALDEAIALSDGIERSISQEARQASDRTVTAWAVARLYENELLPQAMKTLELSRVAYEGGRTPILAVIDAQRSLLETRQTYVAALQSAATALVELERATARPASEILHAAPSSQPAPSATGSAAASMQEMKQ